MKDNVWTWDTLAALLHEHVEVLEDKLKKQGNWNGFKLGSQMDRSTDEVNVMFMEGRILGVNRPT
jgi:hypothetical protein